MFYLSLSGVLGVGEDIYITGGRKNKKTSKEVFVYNTRSKKWTSIWQMNDARRNHGMVMCEKIYVLGGETEQGKQTKEREDSDNEREMFI